MLKCPSCGSNVRFDIGSQKLHCDFCSSYFAPTIFDSLEKDASLQDGSRPGDTGLYEAAVWTCPGCGAVLTYTDDTDITSTCAYCGGRNIMFERIRGERRPDNIVPFSVTKEQCMDNYQRQARKAFLSPGYLRSKSQAESFRGIYMPYFDYYVSLDSDYSLKAENRNYTASSSSTHVYDVYELDGHINGKVFGKSHDASVRFSDDISESLGTFENKKPFSPGYLSGFYAEADDTGLATHLPSDQEVRERIKEAVLRDVSNRLVRSGQDEFTVGTVDGDSISLTPSEVYAERTLYPVWFMSHRMKNGKLTYAAVNGSSGHVVADYPLSFLKVLLFALGTGLVFFLILNILGFMPRPVTALGLTLLLFMGGSVFNSLVLENKIKRLTPGVDSGLPLVRNILLSIAAFFFLIVLFFGGSNGAWKVCTLLGRPFFIAAAILSTVIMSGIVKKIRMEETGVTRREIRLAKIIPIVHLAVSYLIHLISLIVLFREPVNEVYYYTAVLNAVGFMGLFVFTVLVNNYFSYRRPLQFNKKGGDDNA